MNGSAQNYWWQCAELLVAVRKFSGKYHIFVESKCLDYETHCIDYDSLYGDDGFLQN